MAIRIDIGTDYTLDSPGYWDGFWGEDDYVPAGRVDPDGVSNALCEHHRLMWSKPLPCGEMMDLEPVKFCGKNYLRWRDFLFSSDSILCSHVYWQRRDFISRLMPTVEEWRKFVENWKHEGYSPGGIIIWPCHAQSINQCRGVSKVIRDRFDRTLECIRRYYKGEDSPLGKCLERDKGFFDLFGSFKDFVAFFHLQDLVTPDYSEVTMWIGDAAFTTPGYPQTTDDYWQMIDRQRQFLKARNRRITDWAVTRN